MLEPEAPPVAPPPQSEPGIEPPPPEYQATGAKKKAPWIVTAALFLAAKLKTFLAIAWTALKFLKIGKVLLTSGTMLISMWVYALVFGWPLGIGFVLSIFVHEMGHVLVAWKQGHPISAPVFVPGMGAVIFSKKEGQSAWADALMGIGGPVGGAIAGLISWGLFYATGNHMLLALAYITFFMNLFNLMPVFPLDGGWITGAISPRLWIVGLVGLVGMMIWRRFINPMIIVLILMALPRLINGIRHGDASMSDRPAPTKPQRLQMTAYYLGLMAFLAWGMYETHFTVHRGQRGGYVAERLRPSSSSGRYAIRPNRHCSPCG